ncbi:MAG: ATP-binding protein [Actinomycetota bacterium]|nr:ATP-binding protein [Actinomycetota bacterium]
MLIGRVSERQRIARLVTGARVGRSGVAVIVGEAGMGKSVLLSYAGGLADDMRVLRAAGSESEKDVAFAGLLQLCTCSTRSRSRRPQRWGLPWRCVKE